MYYICFALFLILQPHQGISLGISGDDLTELLDFLKHPFSSDLVLDLTCGVPSYTNDLNIIVQEAVKADNANKKAYSEGAIDAIYYEKLKAQNAYKVKSEIKLLMFKIYNYINNCIIKGDSPPSFKRISSLKYAVNNNEYKQNEFNVENNMNSAAKAAIDIIPNKAFYNPYFRSGKEKRSPESRRMDLKKESIQKRGGAHKREGAHTRGESHKREAHTREATNGRRSSVKRTIRNGRSTIPLNRGDPQTRNLEETRRFLFPHFGDSRPLGYSAPGLAFTLNA